MTVAAAEPMPFAWSELDGFQFSGRRMALEEWRQRKEDEGFERLCRRLYARNHARARWQRDPERMQENCRRWRTANPDKVKAAAERLKAKRKAARMKRLTCEECSKVWGQTRRSRFCCQRCRNRWHGRRRKRARGLRNMRLMPTLRRVLRAEPWLTLGEIHDRAPELKRGSLATKLTVTAQAGELIHDGARKWRRYALPGTSQCPQ